jgi:hypothetical protein
MIIAIAGSTGFIAGELIKNLAEYEIIRLTRKDFLLNTKQLADKIKSANVVINLSGSPIIKRWTNANKKKIYNSRIETTSKLVNAITLLESDIHFISASAIGIYSDRGIHNEDSTSFSEGFIYKVIKDWEQEALKLPDYPNHLTIIRTGVVLARDSGLLKKLMPFFNLYLGGRIGTGNQYMSFIHIDDLVSAIKFIIHFRLTGIVNLTAPHFITNKEFTSILSGIIKKPAFLPIPVLLLKLIFGEGSSIITTGHKVIPEKLLKSGFKFNYPDINSALQDLIVQ